MITQTLTDDQILMQVGIVQSGYSTNPATSLPTRQLSKSIDLFRKALQTEQLSDYNSGVSDCKHRVSNLSAKLEMKGGQLALSFVSSGAAKAGLAAASAASGSLTGILSGAKAGASLGASAATVGSASNLAVGAGSASSGQISGLTATLGLTSPLSIALFGIGIGLTIWSIFKSHHAAQVAKERSLLCAYVPAMNDILQKVESAVTTKSITPIDGINILNAVVPEFEKDVHSILKKNSSQCNAACYEDLKLQIIVIKKIDRYKLLQVQQQQKTKSGTIILEGGIGYALAKIFGLV